MNAPPLQRLLASASFFERYLLSLGYFWLAYRQGEVLQRMVLEWPADLPFLSPLLGQAAHGAVLFFVQLFIGALLLAGKTPTRPPRNLKEIFVPLLSCLYFVSYSFVPRLPEGLSKSVFQAGVPVGCVFSGLFLGLIGAVFSLWGVVSLGKSFGIFVSVRKVVLHGPYRFVRHPIYFGYFLIWFGLLLINLSPAMLVLVAGHMGVFVYRARLEEQGLLEGSPAYAAYVRETGFLFPRWPSRARAKAAN
jgi:protein-S-isoprenylcysteine O-methyltransferase Ste14